MSTQQNGSDQKLVVATLKDDALNLLYGKFRDDAQRKIGLEAELPFLNADTLKPLPFSGPQSITTVLEMLCKTGVWEPAQIENGKITSLKGPMGAITLEPGGQIEFASTTHDTLTSLHEDVVKFMSQCQHICAQHNLNIALFGFHPHLSQDECPFISERSRFKALKPVFDAEGGYAAWGQSCSLQVTLDSPSREGAFDRFKTGLILQPIMAAIFANSPFIEGQKTAYKSSRRHKLLELDSPLYKVPHNFYDPSFGIKNWVDHILSIPMSFIVRNEQYIAVSPKAFIEMVGKPLPELGHLPLSERYLTHSDLLDHLTGIKPEMLLKPNLLLEFRAADLGPTPAHWMALTALCTGLFYNDDAYQKTKLLLQNLTPHDIEHMRVSVAAEGLKTQTSYGSIQKIALKLIQIATDGLKEYEPKSICLLDVIKNDVEKGLSPSDHTLSKSNGVDVENVVRSHFIFAAQKTDQPQSPKPPHRFLK